MIQLQPTPRGFTVHIAGDICDLATADAFEARLRGVCRGDGNGNGGRVVLDLSGIRFMNSIGLGVLISSAHAIQAAGCRVILAALPASVSGVLRRCNLEGTFPIVPTVEAALDV